MGLLYADSYVVNDDIKVRIPKVGEIIDCQNEYYQALSVFVATPFDLMVQLDDIGVDFTEVTKYQLFFEMFREAIDEYQAGRAKALDLIWDGHDLNDLFPAIDNTAQRLVFVDSNKRVIINERWYRQLRSALCFLNDIEKKDKRPANSAAKSYLIERARIKQERARRKQQFNSELDDYIVALVNTEGFKYDFDSVRDLTIYQFNRSLQQVLKKTNYDHIMQGYYSGNVDIKKISQDSLNWLSSQKQ